MSEHYDAGLLNDFGGGDVEWWQDYLRAEIERANDFHNERQEFDSSLFIEFLKLKEENMRLNAKVTRMEKALAKFAKLEENYRSANGGDAVFSKGCVYVADLRNAREALK